MSTFWPAGGLLTGLLLVAPPPRWSALAVGACIGGVAANLASGFDGMVSMAYTLISVAESFAATLLLRHRSPDAARLRQPGDVIALAGLSITAAAGGAVLAGTLASVAMDADFWTVFRIWLAAHVSGIVTIGPAVLVVARDGGRTARWSIHGAAEGALMLTLLAAASWQVFFAPHVPEQTAFTPFLLLPFALWSATRFGVPGTISSLLVVNGLCFWGTSLGLGPYTTQHPLLSQMTAQIFSSAVSVVFLVLSTSVESASRSARLHRSLALKLQSAADVERSRLAHELHDDIAQKLAALKMQLELDEMTPHKTGSSGNVAAVDQLIADVRALSRALRPAPFEEGQLIPALAALARAEGRRGGLRVLIDAPMEGVPISREAELACYRVVREAVTNIIKHARANHLAVSALMHADVFSLRVVDDGAGFDVAPAARQAVLDGHLGLIGMQERVEQIGGTLRIRSRRGGGTMVECRVPLMATV